MWYEVLVPSRAVAIFNRMLSYRPSWFLCFTSFVALVVSSCIVLTHNPPLLQLYSARQRLGPFKKSDMMVQRLIRLTVETGSATAITAVLVVICFFALPETDAFIGV